jgi:hypothetical protein
VSSLTNVPESYILFQASQYDNYSYLFYQPKFISLSPTATIPGNLQLSGIRIGVNGVLAPAGQSFATLAAAIGGSNYTAANGQLLSNLGTVIPVELGAGQDLFFLSFDQLGSHVHAFADPPITASPPAPINTPQPDFGIATFERVNSTLSRITGVPITNATVHALYLTQQQSMAATPLISAFVAPSQTAMSQLAGAYCGQLIGTTSYRDAFFGTGLDASLGNTSSSFFGASGSASRAIVINALSNNAVGVNVTPQAASAAKAEADALITRIPQLNSSATVASVTTSVCTAVLGSAAVMLQ